MKKGTFYVFFGLSLLLSSCGQRTEATLADYTVAVYAPVYATGFGIIGSERMKSTILQTKNPWQGAEGTETMLFLARDGEQPPKGFRGQVVEAGARRIVCMSSTHVALLDATGAADRVVAVSGRDQIVNEYVATHKELVAEVGYDGNVNYEALLAQSPDLVLLFGVNAASGMEPKLREMGIPFAYVGEYLEVSPLGKAEWMVALSEITDSRTKGEAAFAPIPERYGRLRERVSDLTEKDPKVMINTPYGGSWFMASASSYVARLIADAGGDYVYRKNTSDRSLPIDLEEAYQLASDADVWINVGNFRSIAEFQSRLPKFTGIPCVVRGAVFNCDKRTNSSGGNDYWESGVVRPDVVLHDLIAIFHPEVLDSVDRELYYYRRLE